MLWGRTIKTYHVRDSPTLRVPNNKVKLFNSFYTQELCHCYRHGSMDTRIDRYALSFQFIYPCFYGWGGFYVSSDRIRVNLYVQFMLTLYLVLILFEQSI